MERKLIHRLQELPHEAVEFHTNEFMSLIRKHPIVRESPAPEKKVAALHDSDTAGVWSNKDGGDDGDPFDDDDGDDGEEEGSSEEED